MGEEDKKGMYQLVVDVIDMDVPPIEDLHLDAPISLDIAVCLPELGGQGYFAPSQFWTEKQLRGAIERGELRAERQARRLFVTRRSIQEWRERCRDQENQPVSGSSRSAAMPKAVSPMSRHGSSETEQKNIALDAARQTLLALRSSLQTTSPGSMPKRPGRRG